MNDQIQLLVNLQNKDTAIMELNEIIKSLPVSIKQWRQEYKIKEDNLNQMQKERADIEKDLRSNERKLQSVDDDLKRFRGKIYEIKTQKEMISLDHEIKKGDNEKSALEDNILKLMDANDDLASKINSLSKELEKELIELKKKEEETNQKIELNTNKLNVFTKERNEISEMIPKNMLALYEKIRANKNNLAVVSVKNGACQGCFLKVPPQMVNEVKEASEIVRCEGCVRILYWEK